MAPIATISRTCSRRTSGASSRRGPSSPHRPSPPVSARPRSAAPHRPIALPGRVLAVSSFDRLEEEDAVGPRQQPPRGDAPAVVEATLGPGETLLAVEHDDLDEAGHWITAAVTAPAGGGKGKTVTITSNHPGNLLLHWGVAKPDQSGWYLPKRKELPPGTKTYKKRALQTCFARVGGNQQRLVLDLKEGSDYSFLDFVVKETIGNEWFSKRGGGNFRVALSEREGAPVVEARAPKATPPPAEIPEHLVGIQAYILWEEAGKPDGADFGDQARSEIQRMVSREGMSLEQIEDHLKNPKPKRSQEPARDPPAPAARDAPQATTLEIPEHLVGVQAYILWEEAGKPDGADFGDQARSEIQRMAQKGMTFGQIEDLLKNPKPASRERRQKTPAHPPAKAPKREAEKVEQEQVSAERRPPPPAPSVPEPAKQSRGAMQWIKPEKKEEAGAGSVPDLAREAQELESAKESPLKDLIQAATVDSSSEGNVTWKRVYQMGNSCNLLAVVRDEAESDEWALTLTTDLPNKVQLHWGLLVAGTSRGKWILPGKSQWPAKTKACEDGISVDTTFGQYRSPPKVPLQQVTIRVPKHAEDAAIGVSFVLKSIDATQWWKDGGRGNFVCPFPVPRSDAAGESVQDALVDEVVDRENCDQWTLMHRFNACSDLTRDVMEGNYNQGGGEDSVAKGFSTLFIWLRYSSMRQLTWQRNYNTQPRILASAQERLTLQLTQAFRETKDHGSAKQWARMCMACVGKGGSNGQKIRDDILHIMHRHKVKEVKGTWMEEWHQKLHNNTTPDDIPICEAYIGFLESGGDREVYWRILSESGLTRERLESFDRAIRCEPEDFPDKREGLVEDFRDYLRTLKSVHSGTDLQTAASACQSVIDSNHDLKSRMGYVLSLAGKASARDAESARSFIQCAVDARAILHDIGAFYDRQDEGRRARDCLYLDAALESQIRACAESAAGSLRTDSTGWVSAAQLVDPLMQNLCLSTGDNSELCYCLQAWQNLPEHYKTKGSLDKEEALLVSSVVDRMKRAVGDLSDKTTALLQPLAHGIGSRTGCDQWTVELFTEEVVRGGPAFSVSLVVSMLEPALRAMAELGSWQIVSPAVEPKLVVPRVYKAQELNTCMHLSFRDPCVLVCDRVTGEEEVPENCLAVLTRDSPDMLSHIAVRARNEKVLLATCHDEREFEDIKSAHAAPIENLAQEEEALRGSAQWFALETTASGSVAYQLVDPPKNASASGSGGSHGGLLGGRKLKISSPKWTGKYVVGIDDFESEVVGAKSKNLAGLRDKVPDWIRLPSSLTIPFSTFEHVLEDCAANAHVAKEISKITEKSSVRKDPERCLEEAKHLAMEVAIPDEMWTALADGMARSEIDWKLSDLGSSASAEEREEIARAIKSVWASKFNLRAYYSLSKARLNFMDVRMAVLIQKVVNARYAFVIHTTNPSTGDDGEIYCEVVKGLGEVLVGNYPGRALSFVANKAKLRKGGGDLSGALTVESFPSKSVGLYLPESLMFRSDSNGEDLEGYAGAGLYDSVPLHYPEPMRVDYSNDPIMTDQGFRMEMLGKVARVGLELEDVLGSAQDIEGCVDHEGNVYVVQTRPQM